ncbi:pyridoxal-phosphate dependent enzyme [Ginsengibacter hankyongi]|uniref:Pyridoxal-phosphate dependent enzyme n=1 Tax=Ginsengibacter hankyongi TaxID=2607284 RepID=A0A5J5IEZ6_9BACT|nr:pyridoxal-phosphate dependent enzyme [Ginsengibacter hankyongi]KAA9037640.1 pyridoxal-phosphate dependent enzyme [Ginsengibacter hankyongi]
MIDLLSKTDNIRIDLLQNKLLDESKISVSMLRLDLIDPVISGNKIFKLSYFLDEAKNSFHKLIITFGGAYSNHLAATAFACRKAGIKSIGFVRAEKPKELSHTLLYCLENGMQLEFISRELYKNINEEKFHGELIKKYGDHTLIPEGGFSQKGADGAKLICNYFNAENYSHICCAIGSATTIAGLIKGSDSEAKIIGFPVLKNLNDVEEKLELLGIESSKVSSIIYEYHFGGYAKRNNNLISYMNSFYMDNKIPLDFVYTGKMMFGVYDLVEKKYFPEGSNILCTHTGGLQGNKSLPEGMLNF